MSKSKKKRKRLSAKFVGHQNYGILKELNDFLDKKYPGTKIEFIELSSGMSEFIYEFDTLEDAKNAEKQIEDFAKFKKSLTKSNFEANRICSSVGSGFSKTMNAEKYILSGRYFRKFKVPYPDIDGHDVYSVSTTDVNYRISKIGFEEVEDHFENERNCFMGEPSWERPIGFKSDLFNNAKKPLAVEQSERCISDPEYAAGVTERLNTIIRENSSPDEDEEEEKKLFKEIIDYRKVVEEDKKDRQAAASEEESSEAQYKDARFEGEFNCFNPEEIHKCDKAIHEETLHEEEMMRESKKK